MKILITPILFIFICCCSEQQIAPISHHHVPGIIDTVIIGDSTQAISCRTPGYLPTYAECRAIGGAYFFDTSIPGYITQLRSNAGCRPNIIIGSAGLNAGWQWKPEGQIEREFYEFMFNVRDLCKFSKVTVIGINRSIILTEDARFEFNNFVKSRADIYVEVPYVENDELDGIHFGYRTIMKLHEILFPK